ncbi:hypothetical protein B0O99DRAFT_613931 [Bisporella sp. PMI_857]|nr:hypothetical protein B0O99DRAFT_613931 [Bisporella sp. PMI_857]
MRLRLTVRRHGLPELPIVWTVESATITISKLLEEVNDAIPIESGEWGYEDYTVELRGTNGVNFECLHYQVVGKVFKEDDEVIIRPLLTQDLKIRRISGRHQISADGKHLVDGLAFGRPLLRRVADRPEVTIPPRKRRKVTYNEAEDDSDDESVLVIKSKADRGDDAESNSANNQQLIIHPDYDDDDDSEDDDDDFIPGDDDESDEDTDASYSGEKEDKVDEDHEVDEQKIKAEINAPTTADENEAALRSVKSISTRAQLRKLHTAFPQSPMAVCKYVLSGSNGDLGEAYEALARGFQPAKPKSTIIETLQDVLAEPQTCKSASQKPPVVESEVQDTLESESEETSDKDEIENPFIDFYDQNGLPPGSIASGTALSFMAEAVHSSPNHLRLTSAGSTTPRESIRLEENEALFHGLNSTPVIDHVSQSQEGGNDKSSDESSSSDSSSDESDDADAETSSSGSSSDDDGDSSSDSDDAPEEVTSKSSPSVSASAEKVELPAKLNVVAKSEPKSLVAPGSGKKSTHLRNQRRRNANTIDRLVKKGVLPAGTTTSEFKKLSLGVDSQNLPSETTPPLLITHTYQTEDFEARRQELLASLAAGGVEVGPQFLDEAKELSSQINQKSDNLSGEIGAHADSAIKSLLHAQGRPKTSANTDVNSAPGSKQPSASQEPVIIDSTSEPKASVPFNTLDASRVAPPETATEAPKANAAPDSVKSTEGSERRSRLNLGAATRMLFGSLGKRMPKTKSDEENLRNEFMKDVRPIPAAKQPSQSAVEEDSGEIDEGPSSWKEKINLSAVECCEEGMQLSEPPFPFVQRWDPQQQSAWSRKGKRGGKRKQEQREQSQYYEDKRAPKRQKQRNGKHNYAAEHALFDASYEPSYQEDSLMYDEENNRATNGINGNIEQDVSEQLMHDLVEDAAVRVSQEPDDLAPLPDDPSTLSDLLPGQAKQGMTIAFKQLIMSEETKWQPILSNYLTAIVIDTPEGEAIQLTLAKRDRARKSYDESTGERIYAKFEVPIDDDDVDGYDLGEGSMLNLFYEELTDPKIVQHAPEDEESLLKLAEGKDGPRTNDSPATGPEAGSFQRSHVTETPLYSDAPNGTNVEKSKQDNLASNEQLETHSENNFPGGQNRITSKEELAPTEEKSSLTDGDSPSSAAAISPMNSLESITKEIDLPESISDGARQTICRFLREAGFGSSVSSSINKIVRPEGMDSPSDVAIFAKLMQDMSETPREPPYSPKFNGIDSSSPIKSLRHLSKSLTKTDDSILSSSPKPQSSWQTVGTDEPSSSPSRNNLLEATSPVEQIGENEEGDENWETIEQESLPPSSPPLQKRIKYVRKRGRSEKERRKSSFHERFENSEFGVFKKEYRLMQRDSHKPTVGVNMDGPAESPLVSARTQSTNQHSRIVMMEIIETSPIPSTELDPVEYPKLTIGSSFTSHISDHGRQPETYVDDGSVDLNSPIAAAFDGNTLLENDGFHPEDAFLQAEDETTHTEPRAEIKSEAEPPSYQPVSENALARQQESESDMEPNSSAHNSPINASTLVGSEFASEDSSPKKNTSDSVQIKCPICQGDFSSTEAADSHLDFCIDEATVKNQPYIVDGRNDNEQAVTPIVFRKSRVPVPSSSKSFSDDEVLPKSSEAVSDNRNDYGSDLDFEADPVSISHSKEEPMFESGSESAPELNIYHRSMGDSDEVSNEASGYSYDMSSDDLPPLEHLLTASQRAREPSPSVPARGSLTIIKPLKVVHARDSSDEDKYVTQKASHMYSNRAQPPVFKSNERRPRNSMSRPSASQVPMRKPREAPSRPSASQPVFNPNTNIWDLTLSSSEAEPEAEGLILSKLEVTASGSTSRAAVIDIGSSSEDYLERALSKTRKLDDEDDDYFETSVEVKKSRRATSLKPEPKRHPGAGNTITASSQASVNSRMASRRAKFR